MSDLRKRTRPPLNRCRTQTRGFHVTHPVHNPCAIKDAANSTISAQYEYGPFGEAIRATGPMAKLNPFRFSTKHQDDESDSVYYSYRYYNASTGRWTGRDPIAERGWIVSLLEASQSTVLPDESDQDDNLYLAFGNAPVARIDLYGLLSPCAEFKYSRQYKGERGGTICKDGKKHFCVWTPKGNNPGIDHCIGEHELAHDEHTKCPCSEGLTWARFTDPSKWQEGECKAWKKELECPRKQKPYTCGKLKGAAKTKCNKEFDEAIQENVDYLRDHKCP